MNKIEVLHIDAFSTIPHQGNPAGVVLHAAHLQEHNMQAIAKAVGFNETAFVLPSSVADFRIRFFTPGHEVDLCGHATMATIYALFVHSSEKNKQLLIETKAGILPVQYELKDGIPLITMQQAPPQFMPFTGDVDALATSIGIQRQDIDTRYPILYGSTGNWTLIIPIRELATFSHMQPQTAQFPTILVDIPRASVHPICLQTTKANYTMHARHFSSPYSGTIEDAVTGTASGVMGAYYKQFIKPSVALPATLLIEQGEEIKKDGTVYVHVSEQQQQLAIAISGTAVMVETMDICYNSAIR